MTEPRSLFWDRDGQPISRDQWAGYHGSAIYRRVAMTWVGEGDGAVTISTVWVGIDYGFGDTAAPLIFETMIFGGPLDGECWRTPTVREANATHDAAVVLVRAEIEVTT